MSRVRPPVLDLKTMKSGIVVHVEGNEVVGPGRGGDLSIHELWGSTVPGQARSFDRMPPGAFVVAGDELTSVARVDLSPADIAQEPSPPKAYEVRVDP